MKNEGGKYLILPPDYEGDVPDGYWVFKSPTYRVFSFVRANAAVIGFGEVGKLPMVRIHSECFTGDVVHSQRCDCGEQLEQSINLIQEHGHGYIIYLRDHEGRGIGLTEKIKAYQLQDQGMDTIDANLHLGHEIDARDWNDAIAIVKALQITAVQLLTNNPNKVAALKGSGITVTQKPLVIVSNKFNEKYLATKEEKLGHTRGGK